MNVLKIRQVINCNDDLLDKVKSLYMISFPEDERRPWENIEEMIINQSPYFKINVATDENDNFIGFMTTWQLPDTLYVEHFAVEQNLRGKGLGAEFFHSVTDGAENVVLEVELPHSGEMADRRISFYERNGLKAMKDFPYFQPPYRDDLQQVPMMLMTKKTIEDPKFFVLMLHTLVYNQ